MDEVSVGLSTHMLRPLGKTNECLGLQFLRISGASALLDAQTFSEAAEEHRQRLRECICVKVRLSGHERGPYHVVTALPDVLAPSESNSARLPPQEWRFATAFKPTLFSSSEEKSDPSRIFIKKASSRSESNDEELVLEFFIGKCRKNLESYMSATPGDHIGSARILLAKLLEESSKRHEVLIKRSKGEQMLRKVHFVDGDTYSPSSSDDALSESLATSLLMRECSATLTFSLFKLDKRQKHLAAQLPIATVAPIRALAFLAEFRNLVDVENRLTREALEVVRAKYNSEKVAVACVNEFPSADDDADTCVYCASTGECCCAKISGSPYIGFAARVLDNPSALIHVSGTYNEFLRRQKGQEKVMPQALSTILDVRSILAGTDPAHTSITDDDFESLTPTGNATLASLSKSPAEVFYEPFHSDECRAVIDGATW